MTTTMDREQETLWDTVKFLNKLHDKEKAEILLKTTIEKSLRLMNVYTPVVLQLHFSIPGENDLEDLKQLDAAIRGKMETYQSEQTFEEVLDYIDMISKMTQKPQETNKKMLASILEKKTKETARVSKRAYAPLDKSAAVETNKERNQQFYTTSEAARKLGLSDQTIRRMCENGKFEGAYRSGGGHWRIPEDNFITSKQQDKIVDELFEQIDRKNKEAGDVDKFDL
ncbi:helix-turn-helix domain-containing protein [Lentibacillus salicampi]|uniref:DNA-binding protein n=1 Tax=Lentibacillus salicampi TaxID=175306 RepID=A0A4Y9A9I1_9BACI|nr:helix-turn-helix domain-containing protein [Lentibacillus salicampi]TFJ92538.1 DNA-binding protein [Lentibacillus salicampi]